MKHNALVDENVLLPSSGNAAIFLPSMVSWFKVHLSNDQDYRVYLSTASPEFAVLESRFVMSGDVPGYEYVKNR
jgi:hypothetical protein